MVTREAGPWRLEGVCEVCLPCRGEGGKGREGEADCAYLESAREGREDGENKPRGGG